jgi:hypothetical protein
VAVGAKQLATTTELITPPILNMRLLLPHSSPPVAVRAAQLTTATELTAPPILNMRLLLLPRSSPPVAARVAAPPIVVKPLLRPSSTRDFDGWLPRLPRRACSEARAARYQPLLCLMPHHHPNRAGMEEAGSGRDPPRCLEACRRAPAVAGSNRRI